MNFMKQILQSWSPILRSDGPHRLESLYLYCMLVKSPSGTSVKSDLQEQGCELLEVELADQNLWLIFLISPLECSQRLLEESFHLSNATISYVRLQTSSWSVESGGRLSYLCPIYRMIE